MLTLMVMILFLWGCDREILTPDIQLDASTDCKGFELKAALDVPQNEDCIAWRFSDNQLIIKHINTGFNCCPEGFDVNLAVKGDTLIISESEHSAMCDCNCLYDLEYTLTGIEKGTWWIRVVEPYIRSSEDEPILFEVNFRKDTSGQVCYTRNFYPWN